MSRSTLNVPAVMAGLKDFQRASVDYVFRRMYTDPDPTRRFLLADEVGLGKTMVARGLVAKTIEHLRGAGVPRIDILYICSNLDIAKQNIARLNVVPEAVVPLASRITLLPKMVRDLNERDLNFITFTPATSFNLRSSLGTVEERVLLYWMLRRIWSLPDRSGPKNLLQGNASTEVFQERIREFSGQDLDASLLEGFARTLENHAEAARANAMPDLRQRFDALCDAFTRQRQNLPAEEAEQRTRMVGELRGLLATACLEALEPDLIILDEFQRFRELLDGEDDAATLAKNLFEWKEARVLLLSATPYKMLTLNEERGGEDHYEDFVRTYRFLSADPAKCDVLQALLRNLRGELLRARPGSVGRLGELKAEVEALLRKVMCRTERLAMDESRAGMLRQVQPAAVLPTRTDLLRYVGLQGVADNLECGEAMEFWKSAPYPLNFMEDYKLKESFEEAGSDPAVRPRLAKLLKTTPDLLMSGDDVSAYRELDPGNVRLRQLMNDTVNAGAWKLLWLPPSLPYYEPSGPYAEEGVAGFTKRLVFSCWRVVPKAVAALLSYEAERRTIVGFQSSAVNTQEARKRRRPLMRFARSEGRLTGMALFTLIYPSSVLAEVVDPLRLGRASGRKTSEEVLVAAEALIAEKLAGLDVRTDPSPGGSEDERWYWAAPVLLDAQDERNAMEGWFENDDLAGAWGGDSDDDSEPEGENVTEERDTAWEDHVGELRNLIAGRIGLGRRPADLARVLAEIALGGPATVAFRGLTRLTGRVEEETLDFVRHYAAYLGRSFLGLFNQPEATALIRASDPREPYWRRTLEYAIRGNLQAVVDEYFHVLREGLGLSDSSQRDLSGGVSEAVIDVLSMRAANVAVDDIQPNESGLSWQTKTQRMRMRFALRFGDEKGEDGTVRTRASTVRSAFNSPFWPFVLATTSVGQEGLDFHPYCHAVVHWNLPSNPVDLEQREGRVHRYKGHAVRKNLARKYGHAMLSGRDPWAAMFSSAVAERPSDASDLVPFWLLPLEGGAQIERHVLAPLLSRDRARLTALRKSLAVYRMVFGQPRQEELMEYLLAALPGEDVARLVEELRIDLAPPREIEQGLA